MQPTHGDDGPPRPGRPAPHPNGSLVWICHSLPSMPAPRSHWKLRRMLTGTEVESNFCFVVHLELKPAREHTEITVSVTLTAPP